MQEERKKMVDANKLKQEEKKLQEQKRLEEEKLTETLFAQKRFEEKEGNLALGIEPTPYAPLIPCIKCKQTHRKGQCKAPF
jgi:hypothetical protein